MSFPSVCIDNDLTWIQIPYRRYYRTALADTLDIYLTLQNMVHDRVMAVFGRDSEDWRPINSCPACSFEVCTRDFSSCDVIYLTDLRTVQVEGETPPTISRMVAIDGNNSLKRLKTAEGRKTADVRHFHSDYFLPREFVDQYAHEVKARQNQTKPDLPDDSDQDADHQTSSDDAFPTEGAGPTTAPCATNWKAAASDETKRMWGMFDETGIFLCACRHGLILWVADMVRSGEL